MSARPVNTFALSTVTGSPGLPPHVAAGYPTSHGRGPGGRDRAQHDPCRPGGPPRPERRRREPPPRPPPAAARPRPRASATARRAAGRRAAAPPRPPRRAPRSRPDAPHARTTIGPTLRSATRPRRPIRGGELGNDRISGRRAAAAAGPRDGAERRRRAASAHSGQRRSPGLGHRRRGDHLAAQRGIATLACRRGDVELADLVDALVGHAGDRDGRRAVEGLSR